jgi:glycolate oxidase iron-sulfur subunit
MQHEIPVEKLGAHGEVMADAVQKCVHCGFCLPACPTYLTLGEEMDSPRGRIILMKSVLEGELSVDEAAPYLDKCLGCVGCVTACPSGVPYGALITTFRGQAEAERKRSLWDRLLRWFVLSTLPYPRRFAWGARMGGLARPLAPLLPGRLRTMLELLPRRLPRPEPIPECTPAVGVRRARVALLAGCAQQVLAPAINAATVRVLATNGVEVLLPRGQGCCGALAAHTGAMPIARRMARHNLRAFPRDVDAIVTTAAGCGSGMHEYALWLMGEPEEEEARAFVRRVQDVSSFLDSLGLQTPPGLTEPARVAYHDACHLAHAQRVRAAPRRLLESIGNLTLLEIPQGEICCGSAGTYNIEQPQIAAQLGREKATAILSTGADLVATGNIGCLTQISQHLRELDRPLPVLHTMQILDAGYRGEALLPVVN